jgi:hypothetical protein
MITVYTPRTEKRFAWQRLRNRAGSPSMGWLDEDGKVFAAPSNIRAEAMIHYQTAARFTRINARVGEIVANDRERPRWHEGNFFGDTFNR